MIQKHIQDAWRTGKRTVANIWNHATKFAGDLDYTMNVGKRLFAAFDPLLQDLGAGQTSRAIVQGFGQYERGRDEAIGMNNRVQAQLSRLRRAVPEIDLD